MDDRARRLLETAYRDELPGDGFLFELLLVAAGLKPAVMAYVDAGTDPIAGSHPHLRLLGELVRLGWAVRSFPGPAGSDIDWVTIAPDRRRALAVEIPLRASETPGCPDPGRQERLLGSALGYPASGTEAYLGLRPRLALEDLGLPAFTSWFAGCTFADDPAGREDARRHLRRLARGFARAYPALVRGIEEEAAKSHGVPPDRERRRSRRTIPARRTQHRRAA